MLTTAVPEEADTLRMRSVQNVHKRKRHTGIGYRGTVVREDFAVWRRWPKGNGAAYARFEHGAHIFCMKISRGAM